MIFLAEVLEVCTGERLRAFNQCIEVGSGLLLHC